MAAKKVKKEEAKPVKNAAIAYRVLAEPWITEKSHSAMALGKYTFKVTKTASKQEVKKAVEGLYGVTVEKVTVVTVKPEEKAFGRYTGVKAGFKKATVTLKKGDAIQLFAA